ncbi:MAG: hypothetical protein ACREH8_07135 [Opitutaceae bacterium]
MRSTCAVCAEEGRVGPQEPGPRRLTWRSDCRRLHGMDGSMDEFQRIVTGILDRYAAQLSATLPGSPLSRVATQLASLVAEAGLPRPLEEDETGAPGGMTEQECAPLIARVVDGVAEPVLHDAARQLVKACFHPEFKVCRDSFREVARDGVCRRQELERARHRVSGAHCVDCPHWVALAPARHFEYLDAEWRNDPRVLAENRDIFLPADFRELRRWLHAAART